MEHGKRVVRNTQSLDLYGLLMFLLHTQDNLVIFVELLLHHSSGNLQKLTYSWNNQQSLFHVLYTFDGVVLLDLLLDRVGITQDFNVRLERLIDHLCCK